MKDRSYNGEFFLDTVYRLHEQEAIQKYHLSKEKGIRKYLEKISELHKRADTNQKQSMVKDMYFRKYIPKESEMKASSIPVGMTKKDVVEELKRSLAEWIDYLMSFEEEHPIWLKYFVFQSVIRMGSKDHETGMYYKRSKDTITPYPELNQEILAKTMDILYHYVMEHKIKEDVLSYYEEYDPNFKSYIERCNFSKIYAVLEQEYLTALKNRNHTVEGVWKMYHQGSREDAFQLVNDLSHKSTGWCSANASFAIAQICGPTAGALEGGDFYVYYTLDLNNQPTIPRIAIRMKNHNSIGEIRGVEKKQHLEDDMLDILEKKLYSLELEDIELEYFLKKIERIRFLKDFEEKIANEEDISSAELAFFYTNSFGFGWSNDRRVALIIQNRNVLEDYSKIDNINEKAIMISQHHESFPEDFKVEDYPLAKCLIEFNYTAIPLISSNLSNYDELMKIAVLKNPSSLHYIEPEKVSNYGLLALYSIQKNGLLLDAVKDEFLTDNEYKMIVKEAIRNYPHMIKVIKLSRFSKKDYQELIMEVGIHHPSLILKEAKWELFSEKETFSMIQEILEKNQYQGIEFVNTEIISQEDYLSLFEKAVQFSPGNLLKVKNIVGKDYKVFCQKLIENHSKEIVNYINPQLLETPKDYEELLLFIIEKGTYSLVPFYKLMDRNAKMGFLDKEIYQKIMKRLIKTNPLFQQVSEDLIREGKYREMMKEVEKIEEEKNRIR